MLIPSRPPKGRPKGCKDTRSRGAPRAGTKVIWPAGVEELYGISGVTRWRWERDGKLPQRDVNIGGKTGWRPGTLAAAEKGATS